MRRTSITALALTLLAATPAAAQIANWQGTVTENWFNDLNWSPEAIPDAGTSVLINTRSPNPTTLAGKVRLVVDELPDEMFSDWFEM